MQLDRFKSNQPEELVQMLHDEFLAEARQEGERAAPSGADVWRHFHPCLVEQRDSSLPQSKRPAEAGVPDAQESPEEIRGEPRLSR